MTSECSEINDIFEAIACSEDKIVHEAFQEGINRGIEESKSEGYHLGFHKGIEFGYELGYYEGIVDTILKLQRKKEIDLTEKVIVVLNKIKFLLGTVPHFNCSKTDFLELRQDIKTMESVEAEVDRIIDFLSPFLPLANSHTVDFIVDNAWEKAIPENIRTEVETKGLDEVLHEFWNRSNKSELSSFLAEAEKYAVESTKFCLTIEKLKELNNYVCKRIAKVNEFMSDKKLHEVEMMGDFVADIALISKASLVVDIGSGKGYLSSILALQYGLKILGIDNKEINSNGAKRTTAKLEKKWKVYERLAQPDWIPPPKPVILKEPCSSHDEYYNKYRWKSNILEDLHKQRTENISKYTNIRSILNDEYPCELHENVILIGLHTCGNLASNCLELFVNNNDKIKAIVNVSCCYHLIEEKSSKNPNWTKKQSINNEEYGFPMSEHLGSKNFALGRDARMCGTQKPLNIFEENEIQSATKPLFYRALLQYYMMEKFPNNFPPGVIGRLAHKCQTFSEYALKALKKLGVTEPIEEEELKSFEEKNLIHWNRLKIFFFLKTALSSVIEAVILLDRLLYLHEKNITNAFIVRLFDPNISPRCYGIVALPDECDFKFKLID